MVFKSLKYSIKNGLDIPIAGSIPSWEIQDSPSCNSVALLGADFPGLSPSFFVKVGQTVSLGQSLFQDKKNESSYFNSPVSGVVREIHRGDKRSFISLVIDVDKQNFANLPITHNQSLSKISQYTRQEVLQKLLDSGQWPLFRMRPFGCVPNPDELPSSLFINAMDTNPLSFQEHMKVVFDENIARVEAGLRVASILMGDASINWVQSSSFGSWKDVISTPTTLRIHTIDGVHPAGLVGTHIHLIDPVGVNKKVWYLSLQGLIALGGLFLDGVPFTERIVCLAGPCVKNPRLIRTCVGANLQDLLKNELSTDWSQCRVISGSVLSGANATSPESSFLGFYDQQISVIPESSPREFMGMIAPGWGKFSLQNVFASVLRKSSFFMTACQNGSVRGMVPIGAYEKVMPLDICITPFLRSLLTKNIEKVIAMGGLELVEEDLALCTFVCQSKNDYGPILREILNLVKKEGIS